MLESDHEVEDEQAPTQQEVEKVAEDVADKVVLDPLEPAADGAAADGTEKGTITQRASQVVSDVKQGAKVRAQKAAKVAGETYAKVKEKTTEYRKELGARTAKVAHATTEATLDAIGKALTGYESSKTYLKSVLSKEALAKMRKDAMEKYPQYFTGEADKNREAFQDFLAQGAEPVHVEHGKTTQLPFRMKNGDILRWNFRVLKNDIEFSVNIRKMQVGGAVEENVRQPQKFLAGENHQGSYNFVYEAGQVVITFSNAYSWFKDKHVAYIAEVVSAEQAATIKTTGGGVAASAEASAQAPANEGGDEAASAATEGASEPDNAAAAIPPVMQQDEEGDGAEQEQQKLPAQPTVMD